MRTLFVLQLKKILKIAKPKLWFGNFQDFLATSTTLCSKSYFFLLKLFEYQCSFWLFTYRRYNQAEQIKKEVICVQILLEIHLTEHGRIHFQGRKTFYTPVLVPPSMHMTSK